MPVRKVKLKDGSIGYQWGTTGKIYKKREDAEKQGIAILLSQRKKRKMKINKELYNELKEKVDSLEKLVNGGKGSGNFGHAGRPGEIGGSAPSGSSASGTSWMEKYAVSDKDAYDYLDKSHGELGITGGLKSLGAAKDGVVKEMAMSLYSALPEKDLMDLARVCLTTEKAETARPKGMKSGSPYDVESFITQAAERLITYAHDIGYRAGFGQGQQAEAETMSKLFDQNYTYIKGRITRAEKTLKSKAKDGGTYGLEYATEAQGRLNVLKANLGKLRDMEARAKGDVYEQIVKKPSKEKLEQVSWNPSVNSFIPTPQQLAKSLNGGKGSGNFGHSGRPGERGGSAPAQTGVLVTAGKTGADLYQAIGESNQRIEEAKRHIDKIEHILGKKPQVDPELVGESSYIYFDQDGKHYSYEKRSETLREQSDDPMSRGKEVFSPEEKKAQADEDWGASWNVKGSDIKKKLKSYGLATDGLSVRRESGGYSDAWYISGSGSKLDLPMIEKIVKRKLEHYDVDERSGEILAGGNTFVFVRDTDKNMLYQKLSNKLDKLALALNGGEGSGNFGHAGRPGKIGGSSSDGLSGISKALATQKKFQDQAKIVREDIEDRIGQKVKEGEEYTALDEASKARFKEFHGEDGTEYTYDKVNGVITKTNPETGDQEVVTKQTKDYKAEQEGVDARDGHRVGTEFADLQAQLSTARTNLKALQRDRDTAYDDLAGRNRYLTRSSEIARAIAYAKGLRKAKLSQETKKLVKDMEAELTDLYDRYTELGTQKYFDPELNHEND